MTPSCRSDKNALFCYETYKSLKLHFTPSAQYDFFKYHGKSLSDVELEGFDTSRYVGFCNKISKGRTRIEIFEFLLSNIATIEDQWIDSFLEGESNWKEWKKRQESLTYRFTSDTKILFEPPMHISRYFKSIDGEYPSVLVKLMRKEISLETVVILDLVFDFNSRLLTQYDRDFVAGPVTRLIDRYQPFVVKYHNLDLTNFKIIIKKRIAEVENVLPF